MHTRRYPIKNFAYNKPQNPDTLQLFLASIGLISIFVRHHPVGTIKDLTMKLSEIISNINGRLGIAELNPMQRRMTETVARCCASCGRLTDECRWSS